MKIYTIGFTKKSAEEFFKLLLNKEIDKIIDVRRRNNSQLAGFAKSEDLEYFLREIGNLGYEYEPKFAPSKELLNAWRDDEVSWEEYEETYLDSLKENIDQIDLTYFDNSCLLCSENVPDKCHRRLLAEYLKEQAEEDIEIEHLKV